jgi:hypothetical protein
MGTLKNKITPGYIKELGSGAYINSDIIINSDLNIIKEVFLQNKESFSNHSDSNYKQINFYREIPEEIKQRVIEEFKVKEPDNENNEEAHVLFAKDNVINIYAPTDKGLFYGLISILQLSTKGYLPEVLVYDYPIAKKRGLKVFLPSSRNIPYFKKLVDMLCLLKFNELMIEVGGAMEYKKHPEINSGWVEYCKEMSEYSGKTTKIQDYTYPWYKNAIHMENGDGEFLKQDEVRDIVKYCTDRNIEVIPEVPSLGHCDYLMLGNHDIAEIQADPYADTYCPSNPKSYEILFDVLEEVIEVFNPNIINIGHDEFYTMAVCDKCKGKNGYDIFAEDINKIYDFLAKRNVRTAIWGDKILRNVYVPGAGNFGGEETIMYTPQFHQKTGKKVGIMPATWQSIDMIPKDIEVLHWVWSLGEELENQLIERDFEFKYGNFEGYLFPNWKKHLSKGSSGAMISNWSTLNEIILQRNGIFFGMAYAYEMFWNHNFEDEDYDIIRDKVLSCLFNLKYPAIEEMKVSEKLLEHADIVEVVYNTDFKVDFKFFVDGVFPEKEVYDIGNFVFKYSDETIQKLPITFGGNISNNKVKWERVKKENPQRGEALYKIEEHLIEVSMNTLPVKFEDETYYRYPVKNPNPEKKLVDFYIEKLPEKDCSINVKSIKYLEE